MRENDGRRLDHRTLEAMRLRAVDAVAAGAHPEDVAAALGVGRGTVYGWRAWQADPQAVQRWKDEDFPAIRAAAKAQGATVYFADEAGIRSDYHAGTTWAPVGATPVVKATGARHSINMISAVTAQGLLRF